jgi:hypothetical protein
VRRELRRLDGLDREAGGCEPAGDVRRVQADVVVLEELAPPRLGRDDGGSS